jgi:hypothetical protein
LKPARRKGLARSDTTGRPLPVIDRLRGLVILLMELEIILLMELESGLIHLPKETFI